MSLELPATIEAAHQQIIDLRVRLARYETLGTNLALTQIETRLVSALLASDVLTREGAREAAAVHGPAFLPSLQCARTHLSRIRGKLAAHDIDLVSVHGTGWKLAPAGKDRLRQILGGAA